MVGRAATMRWTAWMSRIGESGGTAKAHRRVCDFAVLDGHIEIDADEDLFTAEIEVCDGQLVGNRHGGEEMTSRRAE